jgi:hypothetical protein
MFMIFLTKSSASLNVPPKHSIAFAKVMEENREIETVVDSSHRNSIGLNSVRVQDDKTNSQVSNSGMLQLLAVRACAACTAYRGRSSRISESACVDVSDSLFDGLTEGSLGNTRGGAIACTSGDLSSISASSFYRCTIGATVGLCYGGAISVQGPLTLSRCCSAYCESFQYGSFADLSGGGTSSISETSIVLGLASCEVLSIT